MSEWEHHGIDKFGKAKWVYKYIDQDSDFVASALDELGIEWQILKSREFLIRSKTNDSRFTYRHTSGRWKQAYISRPRSPAKGIYSMLLKIHYKLGLSEWCEYLLRMSENESRKQSK